MHAYPMAGTWTVKRYLNHPWANNGYAEVISPHIDDPKTAVYARTPAQALAVAVDRALTNQPSCEGQDHER